MCGITAVINTKNDPKTGLIANATSIISHRGPDDAGYWLWNADGGKLFAAPDSNQNSVRHHQLSLMPSEYPWKVALGHRRLSIIDLSPAGHQPMTDQATGITITYNGEVYNYIELKKELQKLGHTFFSESDTEVLLKSWVQWGEECLNKLNGMFAFVVFDPRNGGNIYAVRDRFGVKPLYYATVGGFIVFASEQKQIRTIPGYSFNPDSSVVASYLAFGHLDRDERTFEGGIKQLKGGSFARVSLSDPANRIVVQQWYHLKHRAWLRSEEEAAEEFRSLLMDSIRLRLRSDVPVGSCLSGGLDSTAIVALASEILQKEHKDHKGQITVTACYPDKRFDEWHFAEEAIKWANAVPERIFPSLDWLKKDFNKLLWHQDDPFASTSQFSQWCVFYGAMKAGLKVMIDGQGADEQLAGYGGNDLALYTGLLRKVKLLTLYKEVSSFKKEKGKFPKGFLIGAMQNVMPPSMRGMFPAQYRLLPDQYPSWINNANINYSPRPYPKDLSTHLKEQVLSTSLPALLRYEDRNSMAWSIESRTPFMDYRFVEFTLGLQEELVFRKGVRKHILREAMTGHMPPNIINRRDKMGFVTPEEVWVREEDKQWFLTEALNTVNEHSDLFKEREAGKLIEHLTTKGNNYNSSLWRIICFGRWHNLMRNNQFSGKD